MPVLVIDDEAQSRQLISELLADEGYSVVQATNGHQALSYLAAAPDLPCVMILDLMMPALNGWDFLHARQGNPVLAPIPTIVISAADTFATAKVLGAQECLLKPLDLDCLVALVRRYCDNAPSS